LKVEIGGDVDATVGAEPSHERNRGEVDCHRGYEWWLMKEARKRNPGISFYGLMWGAPGWFDGGIWSQDHVDYLVSWLECARQNGFTIDYLGGANESGWNRDFYVRLAAALDAHGFSAVKVVATDNHGPPDYYAAATAMASDPEFAAAVDVLGEHDVCVWRSLQTHCHANDDAVGSGKPVWDSENSTQDYDIGAEPLARAMNRHYIDAAVTGNLNWALLSGWYGSFPIGGTGLMVADRPWSGWYDVGPEIWVDAQTTQFTAPGWRYLDGGTGYTPGGASYVSLRSSSTDDYTVVVETMDLSGPETVRFDVTGGLSKHALTAWSTNLATRSTGDDFVHDGTVDATGGSFAVRLEPGRVYTFSTTRGQAKSTARPEASPARQLPMPYDQDFDDLPARPGAGQLAPYVSDVHGGFETAPCAAGRTGLCYQQSVDQAPLSWHGTTMPPTTIVGDPSWWGDYQVSADAMLAEPGNVELLGRVESQQHRVAGYHLRVADTGTWSLVTEDGAGASTTLASGEVPALGVRSWHRLALRFRGDQIAALLDGHQLASVTDDSHTSGQVGFRVGGWQRAQFDNLAVTPTAPAPKVVPHEQVRVEATSEHAANFSGHSYPARYAVDDRVDTAWKSEFDPAQPLPQAITLDLGRSQTVRGLVYRPMVTGAQGGAITAYDIDVSGDGQHWTNAASGYWEATIATKTVSLPAVSTRYVRLTATDSAGCPKNAVAAEIDVATTPVPDLGEGTPPDTQVPHFDNVVPQQQMQATATSQQPGYEAPHAIDGNCGTLWHTAWSPYAPPPQSITLDLGQGYQTTGLLYQPRQDGNPNGIVTDYQVLASADGVTYSEVASGSWPADAATKVATWPATAARFVRLVGVNGSGGYVSAAEINVGFQP
ncbi:MAG TPA: discoidin domain-containing protein, partial [Actinopolymorphaceae bacterium]|nr:discoidin domain-containing protein [Actinopolymorphaceae bacterium]